MIPTAAVAGSDSSRVNADGCTERRATARRRIALTVLGTLIVVGGLTLVLAGRRAQFSAALLAAPIWVLALGALLHLASLVARSEAWNVCVLAAGGSAARRVVFRASGIGSLASVVSAQLGVATRIGALRRTAQDSSPGVTALMAAEVPIVAVEAVLAALFMFTLVGPLGLPAWVPVVVVAGMVGALAGLAGLARRRRSGLWLGLAVLRDLSGRGRLVTFVVVAVIAQIARNWLILHAVGVDASVFDAIAVLIVTVSLSPLPIGPSVGAAAAVLILGVHGVAATAAGGLLLTVTGTVGALCFAGWACADGLLVSLLRGRRSSAGRGGTLAATDDLAHATTAQ